MTLKKLNLTLGERHLATAILTRVQKADPDIARKMRTVRKELNLRDADHQVRKLGERLNEFGLSIPWDAFVDPCYLAEDIRDSVSGKRGILDSIKGNILAAAQKAALELEAHQVALLLGLVDEIELSDEAKAEIEELAVDVLAIAEEKPYTLDSNYIGWLLEQANGVDLSVAVFTDREGKRAEVEMQVTLGQWELFANLVDKLVGAVEVKGN